MARTTAELMRYIQRDMPFGGGLCVAKGATDQQYKDARHLMTDEKKITFYDARTTNGGLGSWKFDTHGLQAITPPPLNVDFAGEIKRGYSVKDPKTSRLLNEYYPALCELAKKVTGAKECYTESHLLREPNPKMVFQNPARFAHSDASARSPPIFRKTLVKRFGVSEEEANSVDICSCNIWHPIETPAYRDPLCLLDSSTVDIARDIAMIPYVNGKGERVTFDDAGFELEGPCYNPNHRWVYISDQRPSEAWIFKQWDTRDGVAKQCYHNSFHDPRYDNDPSKPGRKSMEFRLLLTFPKTQSPPAPAAKL